MLKDVEARLRKGNRVLFTRESACLGELIGLIALQKHRTLVLWALDCAQLPLYKLEAAYPEEGRPRTVLIKCDAWARGQIKMPEAKRAILDAHTVAKDIEDKVYGALCHAVGHAGATVHVETHAVGLPFYELTAVVLENRENYSGPVREKIAYYMDRLHWWQAHTDDEQRTWASFLLDDTRPNKERLLWEKRYKT